MFFRVDDTTADDVGPETTHFHAQWRPSSATTPFGIDHVILDGVAGHGACLGTYVALASLPRYWWG